jgi:hypothetical protein
MKCRLTILIASLIFGFSAQALIAKGKSPSSRHQSVHSSSSKKSMVRGSREENTSAVLVVPITRADIIRILKPETATAIGKRAFPGNQRITGRR